MSLPLPAPTEVKSFSLDDNVVQAIYEMSRHTGQTYSEIVSLAVLSMHHEGRDAWPQALVGDFRDEVAVACRKRGWSVNEWCRQIGANPQMVYRTINKITDRLPVGNRRGSHETWRILEALKELLGYDPSTSSKWGRTY